MEATISFNFSNMKEHITIGKKSFSSNIGSTFLDILSLDTNYIKNEIIDKTNFRDFNDIKRAYKKINKIQPLLFIDEFDLIKYINEFNNKEKILHEYENSISQLKSLINYQKNINESNIIISKLNNDLIYLKKRKNTYLKITKDLPKYINTVFSIILNKIELYKNMIKICYLDNSNTFFNNISELTPIKKYAYYTTFQLKNNDFFKNLPSCNITFSFEFLSQGLNKNLKALIKNDPKSVITELLKKDIYPIYEYNCKTLEQFLQVSFFTCLTKNLNIKLCENCKKYFIAYQRSDEKYCNRISPQNKNKTCKQYANSENWKNNLNKNEELKLYRRIYMSKQMQTRRNPNDLVLKEKFELWKKNAQQYRNNYIHGKITKDKFLKWLNANK